MNRIEFMNQLRALLTDLPVNEREEALTYYENYFEDAGSDNEAKIIREFGSPGRLAAIIREEVYDGGSSFEENTQNNEFTKKSDSAHKDQRDPNANTKKSAGQDYERPPTILYEERVKNAQEKSKEKQKQNTERVILIVLLCILGFPAILAFGGTLLGIFLGFGGTLLGCVVGGISMIGGGIASLIRIPEAGVALIGGGVAAIGVGFIFLSLTLLIFGSWLPKFIRWIRKKFGAPNA